MGRQVGNDALDDEGNGKRGRDAIQDVPAEDRRAQPPPFVLIARLRYKYRVLRGEQTAVNARQRQQGIGEQGEYAILIRAPDPNEQHLQGKTEDAQERLVQHRDRHVPMQFRRGGNLPQQLDRKEQHGHSAASRSFAQGPLDCKPGRFATELTIEQ